MKEVFKKNYREHGLPIFFKGLAPAILRAFPRHAVVLSMFDIISARLKE
jgi:hypothetical protein